MELTNKKDNYKFDQSKEYTGRITLDARIIESLFDNPDDARLFKRSISNYRSFILNMCNYLKLDTELGNTIVVNGTSEDFIGPIRFSYREFIYHILDGLNIDRKYYRNPNLAEILSRKLELYSRIENKYELKKYYPRSYEDYLKGDESYKRFSKVFKALEEGKYSSSDEIVRKARSEKDRYFNAGSRFAPMRFVEEQIKLYTSYITHCEDINKYIYSHHLNGQALKGINTDKFELYVAWEYMKMAEKLHKHQKLAYEFYRQVGKYLSQCNNTVEFKNPLNGEIISTVLLHEKHIAFGSKAVDYVLLREGKPIGEKKEKPVITEEEPKVDISKDDESKEDIPNEETPKVEVPEDETPKEDLEETSIIDQIDLQDPETIERLTGAEVGEVINNNFYLANKAKVLFYKDTGYIGTAVGVKLNKGYTAFIYPNGIVVLDVISSIENLNEAIGNGVYVIHAKDFFALTTLTKKELRSLVDKRKFYYHVSNWQEKVSSQIEADFGEEERKDADRLMRVLEIKTRSLRR